MMFTRKAVYILSLLALVAVAPINVEAAMTVECTSYYSDYYGGIDLDALSGCVDTGEFRSVPIEFNTLIGTNDVIFKCDRGAFDGYEAGSLMTNPPGSGCEIRFETCNAAVNVLNNYPDFPAGLKCSTNGDLM